MAFDGANLKFLILKQETVVLGAEGISVLFKVLDVAIINGDVIGLDDVVDLLGVGGDGTSELSCLTGPGAQRKVSIPLEKPLMDL